MPEQTQATVYEIGGFIATIEGAPLIFDDLGSKKGDKLVELLGMIKTLSEAFRVETEGLSGLEDAWKTLHRGDNYIAGETCQQLYREAKAFAVLHGFIPENYSGEITP